MASIGSLTADMRLQSAAFLRDMGRAQRAIASDTAKMRRSMQQVERATRNLGRQMSQLRGAAVALAGALAVRQFTSFTKAALDSADAIAKQADRVGVSTKNLQELRTAAQLSGVDVAKLDQGIGAFTKRLGELRAGTGALETLLKKTNVALRDQLIAAETTGEAMNIFLDALANTANQADRVALSAAAFSRTVGINMTNLVRDGAAAVQALRQQMSELGLVMEENVLRVAERVKDDLTLLNQAFRTGFDTAIITGLANSVDRSAESLKEARRIGEQFGRAVGAAMRGVVEAARFVASHMREIVAALAALIALKAATIVVGLARAFVVLATAMKAAAAAAGVMAAISAGAKKGLVGLAAAAAAVAAVLLTVDKLSPSIAEASEALTGMRAALKETGDQADENTKAVNANVKALDREIAALANEKLALSRSGEAREETRLSQEILNEQIAAGIDKTDGFTEAEKRLAAQIAFNVRERAKLRKEIEKMTKAEQDAASAAKESADAEKRLAAERAEILQRPILNAVDGVQDAFTTMFENVLNDGEDVFDELATTIKKIFTRMIASLATQQLFGAIFQNAGGAGAASLGGGGFFASIGSFFGGSGQAGRATLPANTNVGGFGVGGQNVGPPTAAQAGAAGGAASGLTSGAAFSGFSFGPLVGAIVLAATLVKSQVRGETTGVKGAINQDLLPFPEDIANQIETNPQRFFLQAASPLAPFSNFLFKGVGPSISVGPGGGAGIGFGASSGKFAFRHSGGDNDFNPASLIKAVTSVADAINAFGQLAGGTGRILSGPGNVQLESPAGGGFLSIITGAPNRSFGDSEAALNDLTIRAIQNTKFDRLAPEIETAIQNSRATTFESFISDVEFVKDLVGITSTLSPLATAIASVNLQFDIMTDRAISLGLSIDSVNAARQREIEAVNLAARVPFLETAVSITDFLKSTAAQFASPADQLVAAQAQFGDLLGRVREGQIELVQPLLQTATSVINLGRQNFASSPDFGGLNHFVRTSLLSVAETVASDEFFDAQVLATQQQTEVLSGGQDALLDALEVVQNELAGIRRQLAEAA